MSVTGGIQSVYQPSRADRVVGWTRDGKRILFRSPRNSWSRFNRLFTVSVDGGLPEELPLPMA
jgi:tricorn protease